MAEVEREQRIGCCSLQSDSKWVMKTSPAFEKKPQDNRFLKDFDQIDVSRCHGRDVADAAFVETLKLVGQGPGDFIVFVLPLRRRRRRRRRCERRVEVKSLSVSDPMGAGVRAQLELRTLVE